MSDPASNVVVTGSNRGLGLEFVRQLAGRVDRLIATCRRPEEADRLAEVADAHPGVVEIVALDVSDPDSIDAAARRVREAAGDVDLLINNAGINGGGSSDRFGSVDAETMTRVLRVNTVGPHLVAQAFAGLLAEGDGTATIVNITSQLGSIENTTGGTWQSYKVSKAGLNMCTQLQAGALRSEGVAVVSMHPGWVRTDMGGSSATLSPEESVSGMLEVIGGLTMDDSGRFLTHDGNELPW